MLIYTAQRLKFIFLKLHFMYRYEMKWKHHYIIITQNKLPGIRKISGVDGN